MRFYYKFETTTFFHMLGARKIIVIMKLFATISKRSHYHLDVYLKTT